jgi:hypothetical protein
MSHRLGLWPLVLLLQLFFANPRLHAQAPQVQYLYPAQVTVGASAEVELIGKQVEKIESFFFSRPGITAEPVSKGKVTLTVAPDARAGDSDVWAVASSGSATPVRLEVGECPVQIEKEPNNAVAQAQEVELPIAVCGRIEPGTDRDWYRVRLKAGDGLTLACRSASLGGTLQPTLVVLDPQGREIAHDTLTQLEPTVHVRAAEAGVYIVGVQDRSYRSTPSPFYRLALTTGPWIVGAYPPTLQKGAAQRVTLYGYRLPAGEPVAKGGPLQRQIIELAKDSIPGPADAGWVLSRSLFVDSLAYRHAGAGGSVRLEFLDRPMQDAAADAKAANAIQREIPFDVVNRFESPRDAVHWYRFQAQTGRTYWLEAVAERIDQPCDLELIVHDANGKPLETIGNLVTPKEVGTDVPLDSRDPAGNWKAPADGDYLLAVRDLLAVATPAPRAYRLSVGPRLEDVRVVALLDDNAGSRGWSLPAGGKLTITLVAVRRGGHAAPIEVRAENPPAGLKIPTVTIAADKSTAVLNVTADKDARSWVGLLHLIATTQANRQPLTVGVRALTRSGPAGQTVSRFCDEAVIAIVGPPKK